MVSFLLVAKFHVFRAKNETGEQYPATPERVQLEQADQLPGVAPDTPAIEQSDPAIPKSDTYWVFRAPPVAAYRHYQQAAARGDAQAQFNLSLVIARCSHSSVRSTAQLESLEDSGNVPAEMIIELARTLQQCGGLFSLLKEYDLRALQQFWLQQAAKQLDVAAVKLALSNTGELYTAELYALLKQAASSAKGNEILEKSVHQSAFEVFRRFIEPELVDLSVVDSGYYRRAPDSLAWDFIGCDSSVDCDMAQFEALMANHFYEYEISDMKLRVQKIYRLLESGNWEQLGFARKHYPGDVTGPETTGGHRPPQ